MKNKSLKATSVVALSLFSLFLFSCKEDMISGEKVDNQNVDSELITKAGNIELPGRTLAANCFQCHGTNGYASEMKIAGESASEIISELNEMKTKDPRSNIMNVHAQAYTSDEIKLIGDYISKQ